jgi:endonuclease/exonuclease/phosphatase family metal-dependent hydrolase
MHGGVGIDGKLSPARIARVLAQCHTDVILLQEVDVGRSRSDGVHQAKLIADALGMEWHFHPVLTEGAGQYGNALLSRWPFHVVRAGLLPIWQDGRWREQRGIAWYNVAIGGLMINVFNTHLGLSRRERVLQAEAILGGDWVGHPDCQGPIVLGGDFNAIPRSRAYRRIAKQLIDVQRSVPRHRPKRTLYGRWPFARIDHLFVSRDLQPLGVKVPRSDLARVASDHLPLVAQMGLPNRRQESDARRQEEAQKLEEGARLAGRKA